MKLIQTSGNRKRAVARATLKPGKGIITINNLLLDHYQPRLARMKIMEPLLIGEKFASKVNISVKIHGGGQISQAEAARLAIAKGLVEFSKSDALRTAFLEYDRHLLIADTRRKEPCKPGDSKARARRQKSYR